MDFTPELCAFQGVIVSADNVHSFSRLTARGGNEDQIEYVVKNILKFLEQQNYINQNTIVQEKYEKLRKFAFYIILNADLPALEKLVENEGIDCVIWTIPTIPKCLMSEMLWSFYMDKFVYEAIVFTCPQLALEIASALIDHFKYFSPSDCLGKLRLVSNAIYRQICRLDFFHSLNNSKPNLLVTALNNLQKCLNYFVEPPNSGKLINMKKDALYKYKGNCLQTMFHLIHECVSQFASVQESSLDNFHDIYRLTYTADSYTELQDFTPNINASKEVMECLAKCNEMLLDICKVLVMDVSVDIFCAWSEFDDNGKSMQQTIGEFCYKLRSKLLNISVISEHPLVNMLQQISRKPVEICELINVSENNTILENIRKTDENRIEWVRALLHKENLCENILLIDELASNLNVLHDEEYCTLYNVCQKYLDKNSENTEKVKILAIKAFQNCNIEAKKEILNDHFKDNCFTDSMETAVFNEMLTEIFNKVIAEKNTDLTNIYTVFLQNPQKVLTKIFNLSAESHQQADIMLQAMKLIEMYSNHYYTHDTEPCIIRVAETVLESYVEKENMQQNFIKFICQLKSNYIIPGIKLLLLIIMPKLHKALLDKDVARIHFQCKLLSEAFALDELMAYRAPVLAMLAQILEVVRWNINTFVMEGPQALNLALQIQISLFDTYDEGIPEKEENWLKSKLRKLHPLNCYYYRKLWNPPGSNFVEIVSGTPVQAGMDTDKLVAWLAQVLCMSNTMEWCNVWDSLSIFDDTQRLSFIHDALLTLTAAVVENGDANAWQCIEHCYFNFVHIARYKFFKEPLTDDQVSTFLNKVAVTMNSIPETNTETIGTILIPLFAYIVSRKDDYNINPQCILSEMLNNDSFLTEINKFFSNGNV